MSDISRVIQGIGVSPGIAIGRAHVIEMGRVSVPHYCLAGEKAVDDEAARFSAALDRAEAELREIEQGASPDLRDHAYLLDVQRLILRDRLIQAETLRIISAERVNAEEALMAALGKARALFESLDDEYMRTRAADLDAVGERLLRILCGERRNGFEEIRERRIIVAPDLSPADTAQLQVERTLALVTDMGGRTSHTSIIARALNIPAVVGAERASRLIRTGDLLVVDGAAGRVILNPTEEEITFYYERQETLETYFQAIRRTTLRPARTLDGQAVKVEANIELIEEVVAAKDNGAEGIGLYRTEFFFMNRRVMPDEEAIFADYREIAELMAPQWVNLRTLDLGADKLAAWYPDPPETNPALGLRSIRLCLRHQGLFRMQLRAILRASAVARNVRLMFPLISGVGELREARRIVAEVKGELRREGIPFDDKMPVGIMIEVPSAVAIADFLAEEADFFSIGTNDLIQYTLAIDRANEHVAYLYEPLHPAVLRLMERVVTAGHRAKIPVSVCGEMAGEPLYVPILLGLGVDCFSMNPQALPRVKNLISRSHLGECRAFVEGVLRMRTAREVNEALLDIIVEKFPEEFTLFDPEALKLRGFSGHAGLRTLAGG